MAIDGPRQLLPVIAIKSHNQPVIDQDRSTACLEQFGMRLATDEPARTQFAQPFATINNHFAP